MNVCLIPMVNDFVVNDVAVVETIADSDFRAGNIAQGAASKSTETATI
jgi:hypothetical protein